MGKNTGNKNKETITRVSFIEKERMGEQVYDPEARTSKFAVWDGNKLTVEKQFLLAGDKVLIPYSPTNNLITNDVVLFPSEPCEYESEDKLLESIRSFLHRYVDVSEVFEITATYYVLFSWLHDRFNELPYLRVRGDYGSGKTRFLHVVGSLCYRSIFASGASSVAPLFHILDKIGGTLLVDEADFRFSDERSDIAKILNNGNAKGFPVLRCEKVNNREFEPRAFKVFGPKVVAARHDYEDAALESRFLTEDMGRRKVREDIPISLPDSFHSEALELRNQLLAYRFRNFRKYTNTELLADRSLEARINQTILPLLSIIQDEKARNQIISQASERNEQVRIDRGMQVEAHVLEAIKVLQDSDSSPISIAEITKKIVASHRHEYERKITPRWIGYIVRKKLHLRTYRRSGVYIIGNDNKSTLNYYYQKYGL